MATEIEILRRRVARIEDLLEKVLPLIPLEMSNAPQTQEFIEDKARDQREVPTDRSRL